MTYVPLLMAEKIISIINCKIIELFEFRKY